MLMKIPFTKAHGARNDFLLTWRADAPEDDLPAIARSICDRYTGVGADGWMLVTPPEDAEADGAIQLYNSDGSSAEISGNGTRCAAALLLRDRTEGEVRIRTGAGIKHLNLIERVWKFVKKGCLGARVLPTYEAFTKAIDDCLANLDTRYKHQMNTLLNLEFQLFDDDLPVLSA